MHERSVGGPSPVFIPGLLDKIEFQHSPLDRKVNKYHKPTLNRNIIPKQRVTMANEMPLNLNAYSMLYIYRNTEYNTLWELVYSAVVLFPESKSFPSNHTGNIIIKLDGKPSITDPYKHMRRIYMLYISTLILHSIFHNNQHIIVGFDNAI